MKRFEVGQTYYTRSIYDHECIFSYKVTARTSKTITLYDIKENRNIGRRKISIWRDEEAAKTEDGVPSVLAGNITA